MSKSKGSSAYVRQAERFKEGDRSMLVVPFDYLLMEELPTDGTLVGGLYPLGVTSNEMSRKRFKGAASAATLAARLRALEMCGLVKQVRMVKTSQTAYQRTKLADKEIAAWKAQTQSTS